MTTKRKQYARVVMSLETGDQDDSPEPDLYFRKAYLADVVPHDNDSVVILVIIVGRRVHRVLIDQGSLTVVMFWSTFVNPRLSPDQLRPHDGCLVGFAGDHVEVRGYVDPRTTFSDKEAARTIVMRYVVVNTPSAYNLLLRRPSISKLGVVASTKHMKMRIAQNMSTFAWSSTDMSGIDPDFLCHRLTMDTRVRPVLQRRRKFNEERRLIIRAETQNLMNANHIREIQYPEWLANVVLVQKSNGKWSMCVDFTDLNKACPKDSHPLPSIDSLVDSASGCHLLSFLDTFSGYNQIRMHPNDESKTAFMAEFASYCYKAMPFGLKNVGATYQHLMDRILSPYSTNSASLCRWHGPHPCGEGIARDRSEEFFATIAKYNLKLNLEKCVFGGRGWEVPRIFVD